MTIDEQLVVLGACREGREWAEDYRSPAQAWRECPNGGWMLWVLARVVEDMPKRKQATSRKQIARCACDCVELVAAHIQHPTVHGLFNAVKQWSEGTAPLRRVSAANNAITDALFHYGSALLNMFMAGGHLPGGTVEDLVTLTVTDLAEAVEIERSSDEYLDLVSNIADVFRLTAKDRPRRAVRLGLARCAGIVRKHFPRPPSIEFE